MSSPLFPPSSSSSPRKPWEKAGRRTSAASTSSNALGSSSSSGTTAAATASAATAPTSAAAASSSTSSGNTTSSSRVLSASPASSAAYGSQYESSYGGGYGSSMYGSGSMYGGSSMYGGGSSSMYGGGMGSSMYGGYGGRSGMYGSQMQGQSEWFAPKEPEGPVPEKQQEISNRIHELGELNTTFLERVDKYGGNFCNFTRRLYKGLIGLHAAVLAGSLHPAAARRLAILAIATFAAVITAALQRRRATPVRGSPWRYQPLPHAHLALGRISAL